jgi:hypothetical protein
MNQLSLFETRLSKLGPITNTFEEDIVNKEETDELLIRNTYINGLQAKPDKKHERPLNLSSRRLQWADNNKNRKDLLCSYNNKELLNNKDIKPIVSHKNMKAVKVILKKSKSADMGKISTGFENLGLGDNSSSSSLKSSFINNSELKGSFVQKDTPDIRPPVSERAANNNASGNKSSGDVTNIIIAPNVKNFINNNIKNIYINNNTDLNKMSNGFPEGLSNTNSPIPNMKNKETADTFSNLMNTSGGFTSKSTNNNINNNTSSSKSALQNNFNITNLIE